MGAVILPSFDGIGEQMDWSGLVVSAYQSRLVVGLSVEASKYMGDMMDFDRECPLLVFWDVELQRQMTLRRVLEA